MATDNEINGPINVSPTCWYYEEPKGLLVVIEKRDDRSGEFIATAQHLIPWRKVAATVERNAQRINPRSEP